MCTSDLVCLQCMQMVLFIVYCNGSTDNVMFISLYTVHTNGSVFSLP